MALKVNTLMKDGLPVLRLAGELDVSQANRLRSHAKELMAQGHKSIVLSMVHLDYLDSSGLGSLVALAKLFRETGGRMVLITNDFVDEILAITRLNDVFEHADSERSALESLGRTSQHTE